jgi:GNAT superfamily N-acetyltransferase
MEHAERIELTLRKALAQDSEFCYRTKRAAFRHYVVLARGGWDEDEQRRLHEERFRQFDFRIVNAGGTDVGFIAVERTPECLTLHHIFFQPEHHGRGIGGRCMAIVMEEARALGVPLRLRVLKVNPRAYALYQRLGMFRSGETDTHHLMEWRACTARC